MLRQTSTGQNEAAIHTCFGDKTQHTKSHFHGGSNSTFDPAVEPLEEAGLSNWKRI